jgi:AraC-like DNA-binding protein
VQFWDTFRWNLVHLVVRLPPPLLAHLRVAVGRDHEIVPTESWDELVSLVCTRAIDVAVVDPRAEGTLAVVEIQRLFARFPTLPVVVYTRLAPDTMKATVELAKRGLQHVVLHKFDDDPRRFRELLERQPAYAMSDAVLARLADELSEMPASLSRAIVRLFEAPAGFEDVEGLASAAGMTRRHVNRWLERVGLASARTLIIAARLVRAYHYMRDPGYLLEDVAQKMGYSTHRMFIRQARELLGLTPTDMRDRLQPEEFVGTLAALLRHRAATTDARDAVLESEEEVIDGVN